MTETKAEAVTAEEEAVEKSPAQLIKQRADNIIENLWYNIGNAYGQRPSSISADFLGTDRGGWSRYELNAEYEDGSVLEVEIRYK